MLSLFLLTLVYDKINIRQKIPLLVMFSVFLILSHYSIGYYLIILSASSIIFIPIILWYEKSKLKSIYSNNNFYFPNIYFLTLIIAVIITWFWYIGSGTVNEGISILSQRIIAEGKDILGPNVIKSPYINSAFGLGFFESPISNQIFRIFQYLVQILISIGLLYAVLKPKYINFNYLLFSISSLIFLLLAITVPWISIYINIQRIFFLSLIILSPFAIIGGIFTYQILLKIFKYLKSYINITIFNSYFNPKDKQINALILIFFILCGYFLFNVGFIFAIQNGSQKDITTMRIPVSASLSYGNINTAYYSSEEYIGAQRIAMFSNPNDLIYSDPFFSTDLISTWHPNVSPFPLNISMIPENSFLFLRDWDIKSNSIYVRDLESKVVNCSYMNIGRDYMNLWKNE